MSKRTDCFRLAAISAVGLFLLTECTKDPNYSQQNLEKVDASVNLFTNGVSVPVGKTEPITLENALKMGESGLDTLFKKDSKGNYSLAVEGNENLDEMIAEFHLEELNNFKGVYFSKEMQYAVGGPGGFSYNIQEFSKSLDFEEKDVVFFDSQTMSSFPKELKALDEMVLDKVNAIVEVKVTGLPNIPGARFYLKNTKLEMPSFIYGEFDDNMLVFNDEIRIYDGVVTLQSAVLTKIKDIQIAGTTEIKGDVKFYSTLYADNFDVDVSSIASNVKLSVKVGVGNGLLASLPGKITISKATIKADYEMQQKQSISFGEILASLQDESVNFALNPEMHISIVTNFGAPIKSDFVMTPYIGGKAQESVTVKGIELPCSDDWQKTKTNKYAIGSKVTASVDETVIPTDLSPLIKRIPDSIAVTIKTGVGESDVCTVFPMASYSCNMDYSFQVPISFENGFNLSFTSDAEITGGTSDFLKRVNVFQLKGEYETTIPLGVNLDVTLLDANDREIALKEPITLNLAASPDGKRTSEGEISIVLAPKEPEKADPRKLRFKYKLNPSTGVNLASSQYIKLDNLKIILPSGIKIDETQE